MKIASKISLSFLITSIVLSAVAAPLFYCYSRDALEKSAARHLLTTVESRGSHVEMFLENQKDSVLMVAETRIIKDLLEKGGSDTDLSGEALKEVNIQLAEFCVSHIDIYEAFVMDAQGEIIASSDAKHIGLDRSSDAYFLGGQEGAYVKDAYFSRTTRRPSMSVSAPVISHITGRLLGVVRFRVNMAALYEIVADRTGLGRTGEVYVINKYGYMITPSREEKDAFLKLRITLTGKKSVVLEEGEEGDYSSVNTYIDYRGIQVLGCNVGIPATKWRLIAEIDRQEVFLPMRRLRTVLLIILLSVPLAGWLAGAVVARSIVSPLRRLIDGAKEVGKGNLDHRVGTASDDEIGELSRAFDGMTGSLKNTTASISELNKEIEKRESEKQS